MECPKCGRPRVAGPECPACGVVYAKFRPPVSPPASAPLPASPRDAGGGAAAGAVEGRGGLRRALVLIAAAGLVAAVAARVVASRRPAEGAATRAPPAAELDTAAAPAEPTPAALAVAPPSSPLTADAPAAAPPPAAPVAGPAQPSAPPPEPASCALYRPEGLADAPARPSVSSEWYQGARGFRRAQDDQASSGAPILAYFFVGWCPHCRRFDAEVLPSAEVRDLGERVVKVRVDAEGDADDRALAQRLSVKAYPTVLLLPAGRPAATRVTSLSSPRAFVDACEGALSNPAREHLDRGVTLARGGPPEEAVRELKAAAGDPRLAPLALDHLGSLALRAGCFGPAEAVYSRVLELAPSYGDGRAHYLRGLARLRSGAVGPALADAEAACRLGHRPGCDVAERARRASPVP